MDDLPKFEPALVQPKAETKDSDIFQPRWRCFCCHDTGWVQPRLVSKVIPDYCLRTHKTVICQNCPLGCEWMHLAGSIDMRFTPAICKKLDLIEREDWALTVKIQFQQRTAIDSAVAKFSQSKSLRSSDRTSEESAIVERKKAEIAAISPQSWRKMAQAYFGQNPDDALD